MSKRAARVLAAVREAEKSSHEAWEDIKARNEETDWNPEALIARRERRLREACRNSDGYSNPYDR